jgi:hypothetical protein
MFQRNGSNAFSIEVPSSSSSPVVLRPNGTNYSSQLVIKGRAAYCDMKFSSDFVRFEGSSSDSSLQRDLNGNVLYYQAERSLYSGSSSGSVSLSIDSSTFDYLQIIFRDSNSNYDSVFVPAGVSKVNLTMGDYLNSTGAAMNTRTINISGKTITQNTGVRSYVATGGTGLSCASDSSNLYITNVLGWSC